MNGPIRTVDLAKQPIREPHDYELTLTFRITQYGKPVDPEFAAALNQIFHDWNDGRYPFPVEQVDDGLRRCVKNAIYQCCQKRAQERYGNEMVTTGPGSMTSLACLEAGKEYDAIMETGDYPDWFNKPDVKIERAE